MDDKTYLFVVVKDAITRPAVLKVYTLNVKEKDLSGRITQFRQRIANLDFDFQSYARQLYDLLLLPAQSLLRNRTDLIIVPDGILWELPFQALQPATGKYLIEDAAVSYAPSMTVLRETVKSHPDRMGHPLSLLAFGNPVVEAPADFVKTRFLDERLVPIPETEQQVRLLGKLYGPSMSKVYVRAEATEGRFKSEAGNYRILQLATHGVLNDSNPMYSHLVLSRPTAGEAEDGLLEAREIMRLNLKRTDLAILSACETARGRIGAGEGMIGLTWALFVAGVPATIVSQWKVEASSTSELLLNFHRNLKLESANTPNGSSKAQALRAAARKLLKTRDFRHPLYWAGFILIGDAR